MKKFIYILLLAVTVGCAGGQEKSPVDIQTLKPAHQPPPMSDVTFLPGDVLEIKFFYTPELNVTQTIRADGKITLQLVGNVEAAGKTSKKLADELKQVYSSQLKNPEIAVIAQSMEGRRVYVSGQVIKPGFYTLNSRMSVLEAVMTAGGFDFPQALASDVVIIRHRNGLRYGLKLDLEKALRGENHDEFYLEPYDIVYVPRTRITRVTQWIDQNINQLIPDFGFTFTKPLGAGTIGLQPRAN